MHAKYVEHSPKLLIAVEIFTFTFGPYLFSDKILFDQVGQLSELLCPTSSSTCLAWFFFIYVESNTVVKKRLLGQRADLLYW